MRDGFPGIVNANEQPQQRRCTDAEQSRARMGIWDE